MRLTIAANHTGYRKSIKQAGLDRVIKIKTPANVLIRRKKAKFFGLQQTLPKSLIRKSAVEGWRGIWGSGKKPIAANIG